MAMVNRLGLSTEDLSSISAFMDPEHDGDIPDLSELGSRVLDRITGEQEGLGRVIVGKFVEYKRLAQRVYITPDGDSVTHADALMDDEGNSTGSWGLVVEDYDTPDDAFQISVPI
jgi:hypothetical protein